jgi:acyl carrier protein
MDSVKQEREIRDMSSLSEFLGKLASMEIKLWADGGKLRCSGPDHLMTPELESEVSARKSELLAFLERANRPEDSAGNDLVRVQRGVEIPLSHGQERLWLLSEMESVESAYNTFAIFRLAGDLDVWALEQSVDLLQRRHEILRTTFPSDNGRPRQLISPANPWILPRADIATDLRQLPPERREPEIRRLLQSEVQQPFDLKAGPLWRARLLRLGEKEHVLSFTMHHIIFDGGSKVVFLRELALFYEAFSAGKIVEISEMPIQYADFACWQRKRLQGEVLKSQFSYWKKQLDGASELRLPTDHPKSPAATFRGGNRAFELPDTLAEALAGLSRREQASLFNTLLAALCALLHRYTDQDDLVVCSPFACRDRAELQGLIGYFNNIIVLRADLSADPSFRELIGRVRRAALEASENQNLPFQRLAELPHLARTPLTRGMFSFQDTSSRTLDLPGIVATSIDIRKEAADFDLAMYMESVGGSLSGVLEYNADVFDDQTISRMLQNFQTVLENVTADPDQRLSSLPRMGKELSEIEALLTSHAKIDKAVVVPLQHHLASVAYLVLNEYDVPSLEEIRAFTRAQLPDYLVPNAFVPLDEIPLAADGSVDRSALLLPVIARGRPENAYVAPRTALERKLAEIWRKVLWLDQDVGIHDRFLDLGGHSLLSVQLAIELEKELHRTLPVKALSQLSTIAELAGILEQEEESSPTAQSLGGGAYGPALLQHSPEIYNGLRAFTAAWQGQRATPESVMVGLNTNGSKQALFWCLQRYQELTQLAKYLGPDQPTYGMRSGNRVMVKNQENIKALAAHYVGEILAVQPKGPFLVGGNCQAAQIAFQIAGQLTDLGHEITLLCLQEKFIPQHYSGRVALLFGSESKFNPYLWFRRPEFGWKKFYTGEFSVNIVSGAHGQFFREPNIQVLVDALRRRIEEAQREPAQSAPARTEDDFQRLPEAAYQAKLTARGSWTAESGQEIKIPVEVKNMSCETWRSSDKSGIAVVNRWLSAKGKVVQWLDGRAPLIRDMKPGSTEEIELTVRTPGKAGRWILELDLIDEGVTWFKDQGSPVIQLQVNVQRNSGFWNRIWSKKKIWPASKQRIQES